MEVHACRVLELWLLLGDHSQDHAQQPNWYQPLQVPCLVRIQLVEEMAHLNAVSRVKSCQFSSKIGQILVSNHKNMKSNNSTIPPSCDHSLETFAPDQPQLLALRRRCPTCRKMVQERRDETMILPEPELSSYSRIEWELHKDGFNMRIPRIGMKTVEWAFVGLTSLVVIFLILTGRIPAAGMPAAVSYLFFLPVPVVLAILFVFFTLTSQSIEFDRKRFVLEHRILGISFRRAKSTAAIRLILYDNFVANEYHNEGLHIVFRNQGEIKLGKKMTTAEMKWLEQMLLQTKARWDEPNPNSLNTSGTNQNGPG